MKLRLHGGSITGCVDPILGSPFPIRSRAVTAGGRGDAQPRELVRERRIGVGNGTLHLLGPQILQPGGLVTSLCRRVPALSYDKPGSGGVRAGPMGGQAARPGRFARRARRREVRHVGGRAWCVVVGPRLVDVGRALIADRIRLVALGRGLVGIGRGLVGIGSGLIRLGCRSLRVDRRRLRCALDRAGRGLVRTLAVYFVPPGTGFPVSREGCAGSPSQIRVTETSDTPVPSPRRVSIARRDPS